MIFGRFYVATKLGKNKDFRFLEVVLVNVDHDGQLPKSGELIAGMYRC